MEKENYKTYTSSSNVCYKLDQQSHSIRDWSMNKADHREMSRLEKVKTGMWKPKRCTRLFPCSEERYTAWENFSSNSDDVFMAKSDE